MPLVNSKELKLTVRATNSFDTSLLLSIFHMQQLAVPVIVAVVALPHVIFFLQDLLADALLCIIISVSFVFQSGSGSHRSMRTGCD